MTNSLHFRDNPGEPLPYLVFNLASKQDRPDWAQERGSFLTWGVTAARRTGRLSNFPNAWNFLKVSGSHEACPAQSHRDGDVSGSDTACPTLRHFPKGGTPL
jgi:hypothetical protein